MKHPSNNYERPKTANSSKLSIKWKVVLALFIFTGIIILILWLFQVVFLEKIYENIKYNQIEITANSILKSTDNTDLKKRAARLSSKYEICILVYNQTEKQVLCSEDNLKNCWIHRFLLVEGPDGYSHLNTESIEYYQESTKNAGGKAYITQFEFQDKFPISAPPAPGSDNKSVIMVLISEDQNGNEIVIFLNSILQPVSATITTLNSMLVIISILILLIAIILGLIISHHIAKPIAEITSGARMLAKGNYDIQFQGNGYSEIDELANTMTYAASELSKVDKLKNDLIANISHDLRTPLTLISGYAEMMRDLPDESTPENLQIIIDEATRMKNLVNDVLDISKIQSGTNQFEMQNFPLTNCIESELTRYNKLRDKDGYNITFEYTEMVTVHGDISCIMRAIYNLVNNAVTHAGTDKEVRVLQSVDKKHKKVRISVIDSGDGIDADKLELIWERYYKVDKTHKRAQIGTGLGLSIVKNIIQAHGGTYGVVSTKGIGSTFYFELDYISSDPISCIDE